MGGSIPKALVKIGDEPNATTILKQAHGMFERVFLVVNINIMDQWYAWFHDLEESTPKLVENVYVVPIKSGLGDGHATMEGIQKSAKFGGGKTADIVVCWGDAFFPDNNTFKELLHKPLNVYSESDALQRGFVPVVFEKNPYVAIEVEHERYVVGASFSKLGEQKESGFHDQSIFRFDRQTLMNALRELDSAFRRNGKYMTPNGELSLLYVFHYLHNSTKKFHIVAYETNYPTMSFNTPEEVREIQAEIDAKWTAQNQF